jgi:cytochrome c oxidase accessory protein FixG
MTKSRGRDRARPHRIRSWRWLAEGAQGIAILGLPFLRLGGESALRFDVPTLTLHLFGASIWIDELFVVLAAALFLCAAFLLVTLVFGRIWCGWGCPQTALADLTRFVAAARRRGGARWAAALAAVAAVAALASANLTWYFVPPQEFFARLAGRSLGPALGGSWVAIAAVLFVDLAFIRQRFCATTCPYAKAQGALLDRYSMIVAYDRTRESDCIGCRACVRACPVDIDIRDGLQAACIACAECVDACRPIMRKLRRAQDLVAYSFGVPGSARRLGRPAAWALGAAAAASLALLVGTAARRSPLDVTVAADARFAPRATSAGEAYNAFSVSLENRGRAALVLDLAVVGAGIDARLRPSEVALAAGEHRRVQVVVTARGLPARRAVRAELVAQARGQRVRAARSLSLVAPEVR